MPARGMSGFSRNGRQVRSNSRSGRRRSVRSSRRTPRKHQGQTRSCTISTLSRALGGARMFTACVACCLAWTSELYHRSVGRPGQAELQVPVACGEGSMPHVLYDLAGADPALRFSPYCWRIRMALAHKGLAVETVPWRFTDRDVIAFSGQGQVPVIRDGETVVSDSWA